MGPLPGGLAIGTIVLMMAISAMNGLSVAGMAIGATIAMPEMLKRNYDKRMVTGVIQAGSSLGIMMPPSVVLVLYGMIARQPVNNLWVAGIGPALMFTVLFIVYIYIRCKLNPKMGPPLPKEERNIPKADKYRLLLLNELAADKSVEPKNPVTEPVRPKVLEPQPVFPSGGELNPVAI
jgi:TRAP-type mannitol/chloroaromatic compound transport system permease large subunit